MEDFLLGVKMNGTEIELNIVNLGTYKVDLKELYKDDVLYSEESKLREEIKQLKKKISDSKYSKELLLKERQLDEIKIKTKAKFKKVLSYFDNVVDIKNRLDSLVLKILNEGKVK